MVSRYFGVHWLACLLSSILVRKKLLPELQLHGLRQSISDFLLVLSVAKLGSAVECAFAEDDLDLLCLLPEMGPEQFGALSFTLSICPTVSYSTIIDRPRSSTAAERSLDFRPYLKNRTSKQQVVSGVDGATWLMPQGSRQPDTWALHSPCFV